MRLEQTSSVARTEFATDDLEVARAMLARSVSKSKSDGLVIESWGEVPFRLEQKSASDEVVTVLCTRVRGGVRALMDRSHHVLFTDVVEGRSEWRSGSLRGDQSRSLVVPAGLELVVEVESAQSVLVAVDTTTVDRWLARYGAERIAPLRAREAIDGSDAMRRAIRLFGEVMPTVTFDNPLVRASLLDVLLSVTADHLALDRAAQTVPVPASLRRAQDHLRAHAGEAVSVADVAAVAGLSIRGLQDQFRRWLDTTPAQYLRTLRLHGVRADLLEARESGTPTRVVSVAGRWGFTNLGRFAHLYAETFGELPSRTLRGGGSDR